MRLRRHSLIGFIVICSALGACGSDDKPAAVESDSTIAAAPAGDTSGADATQPAAGGGDVDCAALKNALASMLVNWQVVIGLTNSPASGWADIPLGTIPQFGAQLETITAALGSDAEATDALSFMSGANDIVQRGIGGDSAAQADLTTYMGTDVTANISKQIPISLAYEKLGCD
jgi:hypothetical protein